MSVVNFTVAESHDDICTDILFDENQEYEAYEHAKSLGLRAFLIVWDGSDAQSIKIIIEIDG